MYMNMGSATLLFIMFVYVVHGFIFERSIVVLSRYIRISQGPGIAPLSKLLSAVPNDDSILIKLRDGISLIAESIVFR